MSIAPHAPIELAMPDSPEWHDLRLTGLGASEAAAACGLSRWSSPLDLYLKKRRLIPPPEDNDAMRLGRKLEPIVRSEFVERSGIEVRRAPCPLYRHPEHEFMLATPDAELVNDDLLECKTMSFHTAKMLGDEGTDDVPAEIVLQAQQQMAVMGRDKCHVAVLIDGRTLRIFPVERHDGLIAKIVKIEAELWQKIQDGMPPEPSWNNERTPDLIKAMHGVTEGKTVDLPEDIAAIWARQEETGKRIKKLTEEREADRARVLMAMEDAAVATLPGCDFELVRHEMPGREVNYIAKPYVMLKQRKLKGI